MSIKLVAVDMDGTLLNENNVLSLKPSRSLRRLRLRGLK